MAYKKKTGGRKIGTPNKFSADIKKMILDAVNELGGKDYFVAQGRNNDTSFNTLIGKVLPLTLANADPKGFVINVVKFSEQEENK